MRKVNLKISKTSKIYRVNTSIQKIFFINTFTDWEYYNSMQEFRKKHPNKKILLTSFKFLRPQKCLPVRC